MSLQLLSYLFILKSYTLFKEEILMDFTLLFIGDKYPDGPVFDWKIRRFIGCRRIEQKMQIVKHR